MEVLELTKNLKFSSSEVLCAVFSLSVLYLVAYKIFYCAFIYPYYRSPLRSLPGPKDHHFLIGQSANQLRGIVQGQTPNEPFLSWMRKWPRASLIRFFSLGNSEALLVTSLAAQNEILQDKCYSFQKLDWWVRLVVDIVGYGLVLSEGEEHKRQRKVLNSMFAISNLRTLIPVFRTSAQRLAAALDEAIEAGDEEIDMFPLYSRATLDSVGVFALGVQLQSIASGSTMSFEECYKEMLEPDTIGQILIAINGYFPIRWLPLGPNRRYVHASRTVHSRLGEVIKERIQEVEDARLGKRTPGTEPRQVVDLLTYMIERRYNADDGYAWSEHDLLKQILTFFAAGHETTTEFLVWATHALANSPRVANRLREEIVGLLDRNPNPDYADLEGLPYLNNFTREVLRLYPPATMITRQASEDVVVQGTMVPKGTPIFILPAVFHHNPTIWGDDCDQFDPDRWDRLSGEAAQSCAFSTFSLGPRMCIGKVMTVMQFKVIMVEMVSRFDFGLADSTELKFVNPSPILRLKGGLRLKVTKARQGS